MVLFIYMFCCRKQGRQSRAEVIHPFRRLPHLHQNINLQAMMSEVSSLVLYNKAYWNRCSLLADFTFTWSGKEYVHPGRLWKLPEFQFSHEVRLRFTAISGME